MIPPILMSELVANGFASARGAKIDPRPVVKIFAPGGSSMWLLTEVSPTDPKIGFGLCDTGQGSPELTHVDLSVLAYVRTVGGQRLEIDMGFKATKPLSEYAAEARRKGRIDA